MDDNPTTLPPALRCGVVLRVTEESCEIRSRHEIETVAFAPRFPSPRVERVAPGNLVAVASISKGASLVIWRWYDAVVLGQDGEMVRLWEPFHGEVTARRRTSYNAPAPGARAYASAGLPGADWWVCGQVTSRDPGDAAVDLDEVCAMYTDNGLWESLT